MTDHIAQILHRRVRRLLGTAAAGLLLSVPVAVVNAADVDTAETAAAAGDGRLLVERLHTLRPDLPIEAVGPSPLPGIFKLELAGGTVFYGTADGRYLFAGDLYELGDTELVNLAEESRIKKRHELMATARDMVVFSPEGPAKAVISVFTDVDCGYCQKLHTEVPKLNAMGVEVRYLAYPRAGIGSRSYEKIVSAWCSADPNTAITRLKSGQTIPDIDCKNPVATHFALGREVGVTGTPAIVLEDGTLLPGYLPAEALAQRLGI